MKLAVYDVARKKVGDIDLKDEVFGAKVSKSLIYEIVKAQLASRRSGSANTKTRSEVRGSSKKIYKQKGTGQARHGSIRATQLKGGGRPKGPKPRDYSYRPTRKMRIGALCSALSLRVQDGTLLIVDKLEFSKPKTKELTGVLNALQVAKGALIVDSRENGGLALSARNLEKTNYIPAEAINTYDVLRHPHLVMTRAAAEAVQARLLPVATTKAKAAAARAAS